MLLIFKKLSLEFSMFTLVTSPVMLSDPLLSSLQGTISLDGQDIRQLNPVWLRSKIGTVSQVGGEGSIFIAFSFKIAFIVCFLLGVEALRREGVRGVQVYYASLLWQVVQGSSGP